MAFQSRAGEVGEGVGSIVHDIHELGEISALVAHRWQHEVVGCGRGREIRGDPSEGEDAT